MTDTIRAIVVDPTKRTIEEALLSTKHGTHGAGTQVPLNEFKRLIGPKYIEGTYLGKGISLMVGVDEDDTCRDFWQFGPDCYPIPGIGVISGHDIMRDHAYDSPISLEDARSKITFTKRIIRGTNVTEFDGGIRVERIAPIVEEGKGR